MDNTLSLKFNPSHIQLPKNIKYLYHTNILVSERAVGIYKHDSQYRSQINKLDNIVFVYNSVFNNLYIFEDLLINERIGRLEKILEFGVSVFKWRSKEVNGFINQTHLAEEDA